MSAAEFADILEQKNGSDIEPPEGRTSLMVSLDGIAHASSPGKEERGVAMLDVDARHRPSERAARYAATEYGLEGRVQPRVDSPEDGDGIGSCGERGTSQYGTRGESPRVTRVQERPGIHSGMAREDP